MQAWLRFTHQVAQSESELVFLPSLIPASHSVMPLHWELLRAASETGPCPGGSAASLPPKLSSLQDFPILPAPESMQVVERFRKGQVSVALTAAGS